MKDHVFRTMAILGFSVFLLSTLLFFTISSYDTAEQFKARNTQLVDDLFEAKLQISVLEEENARLALQGGGDPVDIPGKVFIDFTEHGGSALFFDEDADRDGLVNEIDPNPLSIPTKEQRFTWEYEGNTHEVMISTPRDYYEYYENRRRLTTKELYVTSRDPIILEITSQLAAQMDEYNYKSTSEFVLSFIQHLDYLEDDVTKGIPYPRFPIETLWEEVGDCEDLTYLAASILVNMNIDIVLLDVPGHIVVGVACANCEGASWKHNGKDYYYIESTAEGWRLGEVPSEYQQFLGKNILVRDIVS